MMMQSIRHLTERPCRYRRAIRLLCACVRMLPCRGCGPTTGLTPGRLGAVGLAGKTSGRSAEQRRAIEHSNRGWKRAGTEVAADFRGEEPCTCEKTL